MVSRFGVTVYCAVRPEMTMVTSEPPAGGVGAEDRVLAIGHAQDGGAGRDAGAGDGVADVVLGKVRGVARKVRRGIGQRGVGEGAAAGLGDRPGHGVGVVRADDVVPGEVAVLLGAEPEVAQRPGRGIDLDARDLVQDELEAERGVIALLPLEAGGGLRVVGLVLEREGGQVDEFQEHLARRAVSTGRERGALSTEEEEGTSGGRRAGEPESHRFPQILFNRRDHKDRREAERRLERESGRMPVLCVLRGQILAPVAGSYRPP